MKKIILIVLSISFLLGGCVEDPSEEVDIEKDELNYLITEAGRVVLPLTKYNTLNPLVNDNESYFYFSQLIFEGLFDFDNNFQPISILAEDYAIDDEGTVSIKLREDVLWHDGEEFTSKDVKFTIDALRYEKNTIYSGLINSSINSNEIVAINILDEYNLEISFERISPNILGLLTFPIVPEHKFDNRKMALEEDYIPIGTGPFKFDSANRAKNINLVANENYRFGKPRIENVVGRVLDDEELFITSFEAGQIDITISSQVDWDKYIQSKSVDVIEFISSDYEFIGFNFNNEIFSNDKGRAIRKAINYGIDRQNIIENIYLSHATQTDISIHPNSWFLADGVNKYGYEPETSKRYLNNADFKDSDGDGILEDENGNELKFRYLTNSSNIYRRRAAELIKKDLKEIGIEIIFDFDGLSNEDYDLEIKDTDWTLVNEKVESSDFDIVQLGLNSPVIPNIGHLFHTYGNNNFMNYSDERMDSLITNYESQNIESEANKDLQKHIVDELPYVILFYKNKSMLINSKIIGELNPTYYNPYNGLENCFTAIKGH